MNITAFDPGGTTGWATWDGGHLGLGTSGFNSGQIGPREHHAELFDFMAWKQTQGSIYVSESFEYRQEQRTTVELISREYIGVMKLFCAQRKARPLVQQTAGKVKPFWTDDKIKKLVLWNPGEKHANDAMRHLLHFMVFANPPTKALGNEILHRLR